MMIYLACLACFVLGVLTGGIFVFVRMIRKIKAGMLAGITNDQEIWRLAGMRVALDAVHHQVDAHGRVGIALLEWLDEQRAECRQHENERGVALVTEGT